MSYTRHKSKQICSSTQYSIQYLQNTQGTIAFSTTCKNTFNSQLWKMKCWWALKTAKPVLKQSASDVQATLYLLESNDQLELLPMGDFWLVVDNKYQTTIFPSCTTLWKYQGQYAQVALLSSTICNSLLLMASMWLKWKLVTCKILESPCSLLGIKEIERTAYSLYTDDQIKLWLKT